MRVVTKKIAELTDEEFKYCERANLCALNYDGCGSMRPALRSYKENSTAAERDKVKVVMIMDDRHDNARKLVAWSLVFNDGAYFWTKPHLRNKGYGTVLMKEVKRAIPEPKVYPHTRESGGFFSKFKVKPVYGRSYLTDKPKVC